MALDLAMSNLKIEHCSIDAMTTCRAWFWHLEESGKGPNHYFTATFNASEVERLANVVGQYLPTGFVPNENVVQEGCRSYLDQHTHDALVAMRDSGQQNNIYINSSIDVCDNKLSIENVYARHEVAETEFLIAVVQAAGLTLQEWVVFAGGEGYDSVEVARGKNVFSFLDYVQYDKARV